MDNWIPDLLIFTAGVAAGILFSTIKPLIGSNKKRRTELVIARARILADMKEKHHEEILDEAFRTTDAIRGELNKSLETLRKTLLITPSSVGEIKHSPSLDLEHAKPADSN